MRKPKVDEVSWLLIYSKNGLDVYTDQQDIYTDYRIKLNNKWIKRFYGETAWSDCERFVHDQAIEFWDFKIEDIYAQAYVDTLTELTSRIK